MTVVFETEGFIRHRRRPCVRSAIANRNASFDLALFMQYWQGATFQAGVACLQYPPKAFRAAHWSAKCTTDVSDSDNVSQHAGSHRDAYAHRAGTHNVSVGRAHARMDIRQG
eukprot:2190706-Pyramimonas_sp.AAC.1